MKYQPGQSGNMKGRPKGAINKRTRLAKLLEPHAEELVAKAVKMALNGDTNAMRICIERLIPKIKEEQCRVLIPDAKNKNSQQIATEVLCSLAGEEIGLIELRHLLNFMNEESTIDKQQESVDKISAIMLEAIKKRNQRDC